ncbi:hypothetical protein C0J52_27764 [Blattella germanica]|nr:hypothetical protein C0J52_27764 [Blattella germanica]
MSNDNKSKMVTPQQRGQKLVWYTETKSMIATQQNYRRVYGSDAPDAKTIKLWFNKFLTTGSVLKLSGGVRQVYVVIDWRLRLFFLVLVFLHLNKFNRPSVLKYQIWEI